MSVNTRYARRGLTLIEVLIVIAILLAIGGLVAVNLIPKKDQADIDLTRAQIDQFESSLDMFKMDMKRYPTDDEGLIALWSSDVIEDEDELANWKGPYLNVPKPEDDWGSEWMYMNPSEQVPTMYEILSYGPDREEGTEDDISSLDSYRGEDGELDESFDDFDTGDFDE